MLLYYLNIRFIYAYVICKLQRIFSKNTISINEIYTDAIPIYLYLIFENSSSFPLESSKTLLDTTRPRESWT